MSEPLVKICGLRSREMVEVAGDAGATAIGFMFAPSKRRVTTEEARAMLAGLSATRPAIVGVFVNAPVADIVLTREQVGLDVIQLSGDEKPAVLAELNGRVWKALRFPAGTSLDRARRQIDPWLTVDRPVEALLIDAAVAGAYGGTGHRADWDLVAELAANYPVILAGGLNPSNVADAIRQTRPLGVDVSSGVEQDGAKSPALIEAFLEGVRSTSA